MSWGREQFRKAYNRAKEFDELRKDEAQENSLYYLEVWADEARDYYADECYPTIDTHAKGKLLRLLDKLNIKHAKELLEVIYW